MSPFYLFFNLRNLFHLISNRERSKQNPLKYGTD